MNFGEKLKQLRQARKWSQPELAEAIGIEQSYLSKLENDKSVPSADMLNRILEAFGIDVATLLEGMDATEVRNHLKSIPLVNGNLQAQLNRALRQRSRWIIGASLLCVFGISFIVGGMGFMSTPLVIYDYGSEEIVPNGESGETFQSLEAFIDHEFAATRASMNDSEAGNRTINEAYEILRLSYSSLATPEYRYSYVYQGNSYINQFTSGQDLINLTATGLTHGGTRTFEMYNTRSEIRPAGQLVSLAGAFLLALGLFGFIADYRLSSIKK